MGAAAGPIIGGLAAGGGAAAGGKGGSSGGDIPSFYKDTAGKIASALRFGVNFSDTSGAKFDEQGNLIPIVNPATRRSAGGEAPQNLNRKAIAEAMNFFGNLYNNPDIEGSLDVFRKRLNPAADGSLISDPFFNLVRERGTAQAIEAGRKIGGLRSSGTSQGVANFLTDAEAQQGMFETGLASDAANSLFNLSFLRGQGGFIPTQTFGNVLAGLGGGTVFAPPPQFSNLAGQGGALLGAGIGQLNPSKSSKGMPPTAAQGGTGQ